MIQFSKEGAKMLQELIKAFTGPLTTTGYSLPASNGIQGVPAGQTFKNFFSTFAASFNRNPSAMFPQPNGSSAGNPTPAADYYKNIQAQFVGQAPGQFLSQSTARTRSHSSRGRAFSPGGLVPGAVIINAAADQYSGGQLQPPLPFQQASSPIQALVGIGGGASGLQGFAGQNGGSAPGGFPNSLPQFSQGTFPQGPVNQGGGIGGIMSSFIMPVISFLGTLVSLFKMKKFLGIAKPVKVNTDNLAYNQFQGYLNDKADEEGSFDDYDHYLRKESAVVDDGSGIDNLQQL